MVFVFRILTLSFRGALKLSVILFKAKFYMSCAFIIFGHYFRLLIIVALNAWTNLLPGFFIFLNIKFYIYTGSALL
jgi:hypothetical protein